MAALPVLFAEKKPRSLLDVGCGTGLWLKAALDFGIQDVLGVDGVEIPLEQLSVPADNFLCRNLLGDWDLGRRFDVELCLEVAEHLDPADAPVLIESLTRHSEQIYFSAACPGQRGEHHVNCQWPSYWQELFNARGFVCRDTIRWKIWEDSRIEPWYRQNMFIAVHDPAHSGSEPRLQGVIHPDLLPYLDNIEITQQVRAEAASQIEEGLMPAGWYCSLPLRALWAKMMRHRRG